MYSKISVVAFYLMLSPFVNAQNKFTTYAGHGLSGTQRYSIDFWKNEGLFSLNVPEGFSSTEEPKSGMFGHIEFPADARYEVFKVLGKAQEYVRIIEKDSLAPFTIELGTIRRENNGYRDIHWKCVLHNPKDNTVYLIFSLQNDQNADVILVKRSAFGTLEDLVKRSYELEKKSGQ